MNQKLWFKIGEIAAQLGVSAKEIRYWERIVPEIRPRRSKGNLRYYHLDELPRLQRIRAWLAEGLTVADCRQLLLTGQLTRSLGLFDEEEPAAPLAPAPRSRTKSAPAGLDVLRLRKALEGLLLRLNAPPRAVSRPVPPASELDPPAPRT